MSQQLEIECSWNSPCCCTLWKKNRKLMSYCLFPYCEICGGSGGQNIMIVLLKEIKLNYFCQDYCFVNKPCPKPKTKRNVNISLKCRLHFSVSWIKYPYAWTFIAANSERQTCNHKISI